MPLKLDPMVLTQTLEKTEITGLPPPNRGKVRDVYDLGDRLLIVVSDRLSAFDVVLGTIPFKGQVLNGIAAHWFEATKDILDNHVVSIPDPCAMLVRKLKPISVEVVVRRFITGSLWRDYEKGGRSMYGIRFVDGLRRDQRFPEPILTPTTKADIGDHDTPMSSQEVLQKGLVAPALWKQIEEKAFALFRRGETKAQESGLILVDTKYEFGLDNDRLVLMDEVHTPDSSRYWEMDGYEALFAAGQPQRMLDKENIRQWLIGQGWSGFGPAPKLTDQVRLELAETYLALEERLTKRSPVLHDGNAHERLVRNLQTHGVIG